MLKYLILFFLSGKTQAGLGNFYQEFLQVNLGLKEAKLKKDLSENDLKLKWASKYWLLEGTISRTESDLDTLSTFSRSDTVSHAYAVTLGKGFSFGGTLSLETGLEKTETLSSGLSSVSSIPANAYEFYQTFSYQQSLGKNFLGREFFSEVREAELEFERSSLEFDLENQKKLLEFFSSYLDSSLKKKVVDLEQEALSRSLVTEKLTRRKVRDGLKEKVDLYQAQAATLGQRQNFTQSQQSLTKSLEQLALLLHRQISKEEIPTFNLKNINSQKIPKMTLSRNTELKMLEKQVQVAQENLKRMKMSFMPEIVLGLSHNNNDYDERSSETFSQGSLGGSRYSQSLYAELSLPLGFEQERLNRERSSLNFMLSESKKKKKQQSLEQVLRLTQNQRENSLEQVLLVTKQIELNRKTLKAQRRRYNLGKAELDQVVQAEEKLIQNQKKLLNSFENYFSLVISEYQMGGKIQEFFENQSDLL